MRVALIQLNVSDRPTDNLPLTEGFIRQAASGGARFVLTPEVTNIISTNRTFQNEVLHLEQDDPTLARLRQLADYAIARHYPGIAPRDDRLSFPDRNGVTPSASESALVGLGTPLALPRAGQAPRTTLVSKGWKRVREATGRGAWPTFTARRPNRAGRGR